MARPVPRTAFSYRSFVFANSLMFALGYATTYAESSARTRVAIDFFVPKILSNPLTDMKFGAST